MPTPVRQSRSTGGGGLGQAGAEPVGRPCPRHWAKLLRPALEAVEGRALRAAPGFAQAHRSERRVPFCVPLPPPRGCAHCGWDYYCAGTVARQGALKPGGRRATDRPRTRQRTKRRGARLDAQCWAGTQSGGGGVWAGARPCQWRAP